MPPTIKHGRNIGDQEKHILVKVMNRVTTCARKMSCKFGWKYFCTILPPTEARKRLTLLTRPSSTFTEQMVFH